MSVNNGNTTTNGTKPQTTQNNNPNTRSDGSTLPTTQNNNPNTVSDVIDPNLKSPTKGIEFFIQRLIKFFQGNKELLLASIAIPLFGSWITAQQFEIEQRNNRHTILKEYIDGISSLTFDKDLKEKQKVAKDRSDQAKSIKEKALNSKENITIQSRLHLLQSFKTEKELSDTTDDAKTIAIGQTRTALRRLDGEFKGYVIRFLHESQLIKNKDDSVITLSGADINDVQLKDAPLEDIQLEGAYIKKADFSNAGLQRANLQGAYLDGSNFQGANLQGANLQRVILIPSKEEIKTPKIFLMPEKTLPWFVNKAANLQGANLQGANLQGANLQSANLQNIDLTPFIVPNITIVWNRRVRIAKNTQEYIAADLQGANLQGANLQGANLQEVKNLTLGQIKSAKNWEQACYDPAFNKQLDKWESDNNLRTTTQNREKSCEKFQT